MSHQSRPLAAPFSLREAFRLPDRAGSLFLAMAIYIGAVLLANEWATRVVQITRDGLTLKSVFDFPPDLAITPQNGLIVVGTVVFGITFTQRDRVHRAGRAWVYLMLIVTTILASLQSWLLDVSWRIILASTLAILLSEMVDTEVFHKLRERKWFVRVAASNAVSIPIDTAIFNLVAFGGVLGAGLIVAIMIGDIVVKAVVATLAAFVRARQ
jgi:uncharacterized PurR-regulated membrane protein YhhQ (DUF165 family)